MSEKTRSSEPWWTPENLRKQEQTTRTNANLDEINLHDVFGAYRAFVASGNSGDAQLSNHCAFDSEVISALCRDYRNLLSSLNLPSPLRIADFGCAMGYTTAGLKRMWKGADVEGFDVSQDAVNYASNKWLDCRFFARAITPTEQLSRVPYDLILCQEFYPFTRTRCTETHEQWLDLLLLNLSLGGIAIVTVTSSNHDSINSNFNALRQEFHLRRFPITVPRVSRRLPFALARLAGRVISVVKPAWVRNLYVLQRQ